APSDRIRPNVQPLEEGRKIRRLAFQKMSKGRQEKRLAKTARSRKQNHLRRIGEKLRDGRGLVDVSCTRFAQRAKVGLTKSRTEHSRTLPRPMKCVKLGDNRRGTGDPIDS